MAARTPKPRRSAAKTRAVSAKQDLPVLPFASRDALEAWLAEQHAASAGIWLKIAKKDSGIASVTYSEAVDAALCYGWIDGQKDRFDGDYFLQRFTPRRPRSKWSKINCERVAALVARGKMRPAGLREVERAKADGRWDAAYQGQRTAEVPDDLRRELEANERARAFFDALDSSNRYAILYRLHEAKKPETRARRLAKFVTMLAEGKKLHP
ncbi:MAG TPA: YdeI/OmpD-associated family protein [Thermoanaerobaculia bacterium]|nr:YdeI/OmpD-associated family protein [Thermoanaerobaculia bacterium]